MALLIIQVAGDKRTGMTLDELTEFIAAAHADQTPGDTPVHVQVGWRGQIHKITLT